MLPSGRQIVSRKLTAAAILSLVFGISGAGSGALVVLTTALRSTLLTGAGDVSSAMQQTMLRMDALWTVHGPLMVIGGLLFLAASVALFHRPPLGRRLARIAAGAAILWAVGLGVHVLVELPSIVQPLREAAEAQAPLVETAALGGVLMNCVLVTGCGWVLTWCVRGPAEG